VRDEGLLEQFELSISEAQQLIMKAREMLGWVTKEESEEIIRSLDK
jgi:N utilization substance protein A